MSDEKVKLNEAFLRNTNFTGNNTVLASTSSTSSSRSSADDKLKNAEGFRNLWTSVTSVVGMAAPHLRRNPRLRALTYLAGGASAVGDALIQRAYTGDWDQVKWEQSLVRGGISGGLTAGSGFLRHRDFQTTAARLAQGAGYTDEAASLTRVEALSSNGLKRNDILDKLVQESNVYQQALGKNVSPDKARQIAASAVDKNLPTVDVTKRISNAARLETKAVRQAEVDQLATDAYARLGIDPTNPQYKALVDRVNARKKEILNPNSPYNRDSFLDEINLMETASRKGKLDLKNLDLSNNSSQGTRLMDDIATAANPDPKYAATTVQQVQEQLLAVPQNPNLAQRFWGHAKDKADRLKQPGGFVDVAGEDLKLAGAFAAGKTGLSMMPESLTSFAGTQWHGIGHIAQNAGHLITPLWNSGIHAVFGI